ncbi:OmcA/MtrC family decaheme c-type cytochrome [Shewanella yunxiaonensis]|uniref:OmcA/MtrC family decaheme c-type cytochrome n=1 Tax=Shewanella yunxiaonensis TaxID=2829809 RepID=A0ABX7YXA5_9GAMM|nr:OmcA/MtrC family decaheme c-type cytochrome [Shewanella yunxiaonensis]QUN06961.1 OmcA/MtrC family decaheme c-type cytochrome [Shewanella yunxiaonensis]
MMKKHNKSLLALFLVGLFGLSACTFDGSDGKDGVDGTNGTNGTDGTNGVDGTNGQDAGAVVSTVYKASDVTITIDPASSTLAGSGTFALKFTATAKNQAGAVKPLTGISELRVISATAVTNSTDDGPALYWQNNSKAAGNSSTYMYCTLTGTRGSTNTCTLTEDATNPGTYTGTWAHDGAAPIMYAADDLNAPHRIGLRLSYITDTDGNALPDNVLSTMTYIPATGEVGVESGKDTVANQACMNCHGESVTTGGIAASIGHRYQNVQNCVMCHNPSLQPSAADAEEGYVFDLPAMIHRIHAGSHIATEQFKSWGFIQAEGWNEIAYPAPLDQCTVCHSTEEGQTSWEVPTRVACSGCHSNIDWTTGEGHSEYMLAQTDDSQCAACHSTGALAPINAHKVGERKALASLVQVTFTGASVSAGTLTVTADVTVNGALSSDLSVLGVKSTLMGNVDSNGEVHRWGSRPALTSGNFDAGVGKLTLTRALGATENASMYTGTIYVGTEATFCVGSDKKAATCDETADLAYGNPIEVVHNSPVFSTAIGVTTKTKFFDLDTVDAADEGTAARFTDDNRITVAVSKCEACHNSLDVTKGPTHGVYTFDQCMDCHNNDYPGSYHVNAVYKDADGNSQNSGVTFYNRDLVTVVHRFHAGNFDVIEGIYKDADGDVVGFPGVQGDCSACHKEGTSFFADDGGLTSGKRSIAVSGGYISPVAESCRSCHTSASALAHFESNGAITDTLPAGTAILPVESCATCHAQGKSFGIDQFHIIK